LVSAGGCDSIITTNLSVVPVITASVNAQICNGQTYTLPDGTVVSAAGAYDVTLVSSNGCDSIITTTLALLNSVTSTINAQICNGQSYIMPDGTSIGIAGLYTFNFIATNGCDSIVNVNLNVISSSTPSVALISGSPSPICQGSLVSFTATATDAGLNPTFEWYINGALLVGQTASTFATTGLNDGDEVHVVVLSSDSCANPQQAISSTIQVAVLPLVVPSATIATNAPSVICTGTDYLFTSSISNGGLNPQYQWMINGNPLPGATGDTLLTSVLVNGDVLTLQLQSSDVCANPSTVISNSITIQAVNPVTPLVTITENPASPHCQGSPVSFISQMVNTGSNPAFTWMVNGSPVPAQGPASLTLNNLADGDTVQLIIVASQFCQTNDTAVSNAVIVQIDSLLTPSVSIYALPGGPQCMGVPITYYANPVNGGTNPLYQWFVNGNPVNGQTPNNYFVISNLTTGDYVSVVLVSNYPCLTNNNVGSNAVFFELAPMVEAEVYITADTSGLVCSGVPVQFQAFGSNAGEFAAYQWYINGIPVSGAVDSIFISSTLASGDVITASMVPNNPCAINTIAFSNQITLTVTQSVTPVVTITSDLIRVCEGEPVRFIAFPTLPGSAPVYSWYINDAIAQSGSNTLFTTNSLLQGDTVWCHMLTDVLCPTVNPAISNGIPVKVNPRPLIDAGPDYYINIGDTITITPVSNVVSATYSWNPNLNLICEGTGCSWVFAFPEDTTTYYITVFDNETGCSAVDSMTVFVDNLIDIYLPSAFSPNGDGFNDVLFLRGHGIVEFNLRIYDRWGALIFETDDLERGWDGTLYDKKCEQGTYVYILNYTLRKQAPKTEKGNILLVR
jgi:gliding motility-associated-like protein